MTERLHLSPEHQAVIEALLREHLPGVEVWAYGSRVDGRFAILPDEGIACLLSGFCPSWGATDRKAGVEGQGLCVPAS